jgi:hypothetical protein
MHVSCINYVKNVEENLPKFLRIALPVKSKNCKHIVDSGTWSKIINEQNEILSEYSFGCLCEMSIVFV